MKTPRFHRVAVLMGGVSSERDISIQSGQAVVDGLRSAGYDAVPVLLQDESPDLPHGIEAVFIALHGCFGEDGGIQRLLDAEAMPYTGSGARSCHVSFDKVLTRQALESAGLPVARGQVLAPDDTVRAVSLPLPLVTKPPREGSSVGVSIVRSPEELESAILEARRYADEVLLEAFIPGREWTVGIVGETLLPPIEIEPDLDGGWYSWKAKYFSNGTTRYTFPDGQPSEMKLCDRCRALAWAAFRVLGARGFGRVDFRVTPEGDPFILELNAIPGFTPNSLLPKAAARAGIPFPDLCARILESARCG